MYSGFRNKLAVPPSIKHPSFFVALKLKNVALPHPNHGHVVLAKPSPILFYPISSTEVRLCLALVSFMRLVHTVHESVTFGCHRQRSATCCHGCQPPRAMQPKCCVPWPGFQSPFLQRRLCIVTCRNAAAPQTRCLVDVPGEKLPSDLVGYLRTTVLPEVRRCC